ncbi:MAG TPA: sulfurtransferase TusA family protein [Chloroflexia bacterium]|nr:sulfurtransferase TusA family protein [Chloroflexia bacterium]
MPPVPPVDATVDGGPLGCGELLVLLHQQMRTLQPGQVLEVVTYDPGAHEDLPAWCRLVGHTLLAEQDKRFYIRKGGR